jgi:hypothetical protein
MPQTFDENTPRAWELNQCAWSFVDREAVRMIQAVSDANKGHLPTAGGMLDQTPGFVDAYRLVNSERAAYQKGQNDG